MSATVMAQARALGACRRGRDDAGMRRALSGLMLAAALAAALLSGCDRKPGTSPVASSASQPASAGGPTEPVLAPNAPALPTDAERANGARLAAQGVQGGAPCLSCHGARGEGNAAANFPRLAGQGYVYLVHQLESYADDSRRDPVMGPIAKALSAEQRRAVAAHYAAIGTGMVTPLAASDASAGSASAGSAASASASAPPPAQASASAPAQGGRNSAAPQLAGNGDDKRQLQACANCHGADGGGLGQTIPSLAGQHASYLVTTLGAWRDGSRHNDGSGQMPRIAKALTDAEVQALAAWYAAQPPAAAGARGTVASAVPAGGGTAAVVSGPKPAAGGASGTGATQGAPGTGTGTGTGTGMGTGTEAHTGTGSEQGAPLTGGAQGPGGGGGATRSGP